MGLAQYHGFGSPMGIKHIIIQQDDLSWKHKRTHDWKSYQLSKLNATDIDIDSKVKNFILSHPTWRFNLTWANPDIKKFAASNQILVNDQQYDFFIICDMEFGKLPLVEIEELIREYHTVSNHGGYFAMQSYYLNWQNDDAVVKPELSDDMDQAVPQWVEKHLSISDFTNDSLKISNPLSNIDSQGRLIAGSDFMYTHGNIRFWLWKR